MGRLEKRWEVWRRKKDWINESNQEKARFVFLIFLTQGATTSIMLSLLWHQQINSQVVFFSVANCIIT